MLYDALLRCFHLRHEGNHTLYGVIARFVDLKKFKENPSLPTAQESVVQLGDIPPHTATLSLAKIKNTSKINNIRRGCVTCYMDDVQRTRRFGE